MAATRAHVFVVPTYAGDQVANALHTADLAAAHGFEPVIVCNSAGTEAALAGEPRAMTAGANTGYGGAAGLVAERTTFDTMILCNDDLTFTDAAMAAVKAAVGRDDGPAIVGFLPRTRPGIRPVPQVAGVLGIVSGAAAATRRLHERTIRRRAESLLDAGDGVRPLPAGLFFPFICVAISRRAWESLGGFDPRFPLYFEDIDLLARARRCGLDVGVALVDCDHARTATGRTVLPYSLPLMSVGARNCLERHHGVPRPFAAAMVTVGLVARAAFWAPLRAQRGEELRGIRRAIPAIWSRAPVPMPPWG